MRIQVQKKKQPLSQRIRDAGGLRTREIHLYRVKFDDHEEYGTWLSFDEMVALLCIAGLTRSRAEKLTWEAATPQCAEKYVYDTETCAWEVIAW